MTTVWQNARQSRDDAARLKCFDELAKQQPAAKEVVTAITAEKECSPEGTVETEKKVISVMEKYWDMSLDPKKERNIFVLWPYRPCYFLPLAYNSSPNEDAALDFDPDAKARHNEVKFQLSFKFKLWRDIVRNQAIKDIIEKSTGIRGDGSLGSLHTAIVLAALQLGIFRALQRHQLRTGTAFEFPHAT